MNGTAFRVASSTTLQLFTKSYCPNSKSMFRAATVMPTTTTTYNSRAFSTSSFCLHSDNINNSATHGYLTKDVIGLNASVLTKKLPATQ